MANLQRKRPGAARGAVPAALAALLLLGPGCSGDSLGAVESILRGAGVYRSGGTLDTNTIVAGLRDALRVSTDEAVSRTSALNGFLANELIRIHLPESLESMARTLRSVGFGPQVDELDVAMNRAAERAAGQATDVFLDAIRQMTFRDARGILDGGDTAATDYFRRTSSAALRSRFEPIVARKMETVGLARLYSDLVGHYRLLPIPNKQEAPELESYVTDHALDGLFTVLGQEETRIRTDPEARVTELLRTVFADET